MDGYRLQYAIIDELGPNPQVIHYGEDSDSDSLGHFFCAVCDPEGLVALCGTDISGKQLVDEDEIRDDDCIVCLDLNPLPCEKCGC